MKRFLAVLVLVVMMCGCVGLAEEKPFDYKELEGLDGYSYDKFEKMWDYIGRYDQKQTDGYLSIFLQANGGKNTVNFIALGVVKKTTTGYIVADKIAILADDTLITVGLMNFETMQAKLLTESHAEALRILAEAEKISFKIYYEDGSSTVLEPTKDVAPFAQVAKEIYERNLLAYNSNMGFDYTTMQNLENDFPLTIEE